MTAAIYPDNLAVGQVETYRVETDQLGQSFILTVDGDPAGHVEAVAGTNGARFTFWADKEGEYIVTAQGDMGDVAQLVLAVASLPNDLVAMERAIVERIASVVRAVPHMGPVHPTERFLEGDAEDVAETTTPDPVALAIPLTNYLEIGIPTVGVSEHSGDSCVKMAFEYPLSYTLGVRDKWAKDGFPYHSSGEMFIALYLLTLRALAQKRTLGFVNVWCGLLQQERPSTLTNEEGEALDHIADWTLTVTATRPL